jgi:hypothetical protein
MPEIVGSRGLVFFLNLRQSFDMLPMKMDRSQIIIAKQADLDKEDTEYWKHAPIKEKLQTITYLRECFYGKEATTGQVQRVHTVLKLK